MPAVYDVGIAGAGQLARMTCLAAWPLGLRVAVLGRADEPAGPMAAGIVEGDWKDAEDVARLGAAVGVVTLENEFVDAAALAAVEAAGRRCARRGVPRRRAGQGPARRTCSPRRPARPPPSSWSIARGSSPPPAGSWAGR